MKTVISSPVSRSGVSVRTSTSTPTGSVITGRETLEAFFGIDERSVYTGEIALVDPRSPIASTGITYYNGLHDENAACHLAFGKAYPFTLKEQRNYSDEELLEMGMNVSTVHEDAMIGGMDVNVTAVLKDGSKVEIIRDGKYLI